MQTAARNGVGLRVLLLGLALVVVAGFSLGVSAAQAQAVQTDFYGLYFPAGMTGTGTTCPYTVNPLGMCVIDPGETAELPSGHLQIRDMVILELAVSWRADGSTEPRKTGYDIVIANASVDSTFSGPTWGTWTFHPATGDVFTGIFHGKFENGIPAVRFVGEGTGVYDGQRMSGDIYRTVQSWGGNMVGRFLEPARPS